MKCKFCGASAIRIETEPTDEGCRVVFQCGTVYDSTDWKAVDADKWERTCRPVKGSVYQ